MEFKLRKMQLIYGTFSVHENDFEEFYRSVLKSSVAYLEFLGTVDYETRRYGLDIKIASVGESVDASGYHQTNKWDVTFTCVKYSGISINLIGECKYDLGVLRDNLTGDVLFSEPYASELENNFSDMLKNHGIEADASAVWYNEDPRYTLDWVEVDAYNDAKLRVDQEFSHLMR